MYIGLNLPDELFDKIEELASAANMPVSDYILGALVLYFGNTDKEGTE